MELGNTKYPVVPCLVSATNPYWQWIQKTRNDLGNLTDHSTDQDAKNFFQSFRFHNPVVMKLPQWAAFRWTLDDLRAKVGNEIVQVQANRNSDTDYELHPTKHQKSMSFAQFIDQVEHGTDNDIYMTARNSDEHRHLTSILAPDMTPMPSYLTNRPETAFFWIGRNTTTPLHHDTSHVVMAQISGRKLVRTIAPEYFEHVQHRQGVHTHIDWIDETYGVPFHDLWIDSGDAVFLPAGWWHQVRSWGVSITATFTNFIWGNEAHVGFNPVK